MEEDNIQEFKPVRNERGYFVVANSLGEAVPEELEQGTWLSEREANIAIMLYMDRYNKAKEEILNKIAKQNNSKKSSAETEEG